MICDPSHGFIFYQNCSRLMCQTEGSLLAPSVARIALFVTWFSPQCEHGFHSSAIVMSSEAGEQRLSGLAPCSLSGNTLWKVLL